MVLACITSVDAHSWYDDKCCHDKDCHPAPWEIVVWLRSLDLVNTWRVIAPANGLLAFWTLDPPHLALGSCLDTLPGPKDDARQP
jgi:hypothetical protein